LANGLISNYTHPQDLTDGIEPLEQLAKMLVWCALAIKMIDLLGYSKGVEVGSRFTLQFKERMTSIQPELRLHKILRTALFLNLLYPYTSDNPNNELRNWPQCLLSMWQWNEIQAMLRCQAI
jgi:hypothetical protein